MAKRRDYIPSKLLEFVRYQGFLCKQVTEHAEAWGIPEAEVEEFGRRRAEYEAAQKKAGNDILRSRADIMRHNELRTDYTRYIRGLVQRYLAHNPMVKPDERFALGLAVDTVRRRKLREINELAHCYPQAIGGLRVRFSCRVPHTEGRPKLHPECHAVEVEYMLLDSPQLPDMRTFVATGRHMSSRAQFTMELGRPGQWLHSRAR